MTIFFCPESCFA